MWGLLISTFATSAADSLNPFAITQQFVLQGMVKRPKHIWYFILPTGIVNLITGFLAYFGLVALMGSFFSGLMERYGHLLPALELVLGLGFCIGVVLLLQKSRAGAAQKQREATEACQEAREEQRDKETAARNIKSVSPLALVMLGVGATLSELATALPYFAFLAILLNHQLTLWQVTFLLILYNTIYMLPLMILYFVYIKAQSQFDRLYRVIKRRIAKWASLLGPALMGLMGIALVCHAMSLLLRR